MTCPSCGAENPATSRFCGQCATALALVCQSCGTPASAGQRFCGQCAAPLNGDSASTVPIPRASTVAAPAHAENRPVSVLFVDLVGFTALSEARDPEDVRELLSGYFDAARTVVGRYGGTIEKFIGDAVMAVWGVPAAREDDAERAVRAALEIVDAVTTFGAEHGVASLRGRAGVVSGSVTAWNTPGEGIVAGDRVNTASRIQSVAEPGTVYVDDVTRHATSAAIAYADVGEHVVKGKAEPLHLWRAEQVLAGIGGLQRVDGLEARFVGRDADLRLVKELFHGAVDRDSARLISVVGVAGVGKSRLCWEFEKYVDGLATDVLWHGGRCLSYGEGVAYWALAQMVRQRFAIAEEDPADIVAEKFAAGLVEWIEDTADRDYLRPRLGALLGIGDLELDREELFAGWRLFFERLAGDLPVVLAFEDLQWADAGLLDFIEHLLDWAGDHPIVVVTLARPELAERRPGWAAGRRNATSLYLEPLPPELMAGVLDDLVTDLPAGVRDRIVEHAEGIPLYALETVRSLIDRDVVVPRDGVYALVGDIGDLDVPASLTSLIAARIDALPADERSLVKDLSVLGGSFPRAAVIAVVDFDEETIDRLLANLVRKEFLTVRTDRRSPDRGQYVFAQTLLRSVAHDMLSKRERKVRHVAVAKHLRATFDNDGEEVAEVVAVHYRDALLAGENDDDAEEIRAEAIAAFVRAGVRAATLGAPESAGRIYSTAAELATDETQRMPLLEQAAEMSLDAGRHVEAVERFAAVRASYESRGLLSESARLARGHARALVRLGRMAETIELLERALTTVDETTSEYADLCSGLASALIFAGRIPEADSYAERAVVAAQTLGLPLVFCQALTTRAMALAYIDRVEEAVILVEAAVGIAQTKGLTKQEQFTRTIASDLLMTNDLPGAVEHAQSVLTTSRRRGERYVESIAGTNLAYAWLYAGEWEQIQRLIDELFATGGADRTQWEIILARQVVLDAWRGNVESARAALGRMGGLRTSGSTDDQAGVAALDAVVACAAGEHAAAVAAGTVMCTELVPQIGIRNEAVRLNWVAAVDSAFAIGDLDSARTFVTLVDHRAPALIPPYLRHMAAHFRARLAAAERDNETAERLFDAADEGLAELGYRYWLARARLDRAEWLVSLDRNAEAANYAAQAATVFESLGASVWRDRAGRLATHEIDIEVAVPSDLATPAPT